MKKITLMLIVVSTLLASQVSFARLSDGTYSGGYANEIYTEALTLKDVKCSGGKMTSAKYGGRTLNVSRAIILCMESVKVANDIAASTIFKKQVGVKLTNRERRKSRRNSDVMRCPAIVSKLSGKLYGSVIVANKGRKLYNNDRGRWYAVQNEKDVRDAFSLKAERLNGCGALTITRLTLEDKTDNYSRFYNATRMDGKGGVYSNSGYKKFSFDLATGAVSKSSKESFFYVGKGSKRTTYIAGFAGIRKVEYSNFVPYKNTSESTYRLPKNF